MAGLTTRPVVAETPPQEAQQIPVAGKAPIMTSQGMMQRAAKSISRGFERTKAAPSPADETDVSWPSAPRFADLKVYKFIKKHRDIGKVFGVENPFYREHSGRQGATTSMGGKTFINFASYDYLGLNQDPSVGEAAKTAIELMGTSVSASRLVAGERSVHRELERALAEFYGAEDCLSFVSGHATNVSVISTLMGPGDLIIHDDLVHNSAVVGSKLSQATCVSFRHNNLESLEAMLKEHRGKHSQVLIVVEGFYSMDGDYPDLPGLIALKQRYGAWLMVDEAHSLGVLGATGHGIFEHFDVDPRSVDIWMGTLSKTLGSCGGYIAGKRELIEILKFQAPGFVYSVGLSPPLAAAALRSLRLLKAQPERVQRLQKNGRLFLTEAKNAGLDTGSSQGYAVVPVIVGDSLRSAKLTEKLMKRGINALPIFYPAVPMKAARLRFFITSEHTSEQIFATIRAVREELDAGDGARVAVGAAISRLVAR